MFRKIIFIYFLLSINFYCFAKNDTLRIMCYNVLHYGNGCQGANGNYHQYLNTIVQFTNPGVIGLIKVNAVPKDKNLNKTDGIYGFADSILAFALNKSYPNRYDYCPCTNFAKANNINLLFYDHNKLGFVRIVSTYSNITDFNIYQFYIKDLHSDQSKDSTFLYIMLNHDKSGAENEEIRKEQIEGSMNELKKHFKRLPNFIDMGDFNVRTSRELCYQLLTNTDDSNFLFYDPPFMPDRKLKYPAEWNHNKDYAAYFTTSTRAFYNYPNSCGTGGGAKDWYDHFFLSPSLINNKNNLHYIPNSYRTIGNDGKRLRKSINDNKPKNLSVSTVVRDALFQMSNKYPIMMDLEIKK